MQRNGKLGSDCVERVEVLMKNLGFKKNVSTNRTEGSQSGRWCKADLEGKPTGATSPNRGSRM
jgi:hypothetical protein